MDKFELYEAVKTSVEIRYMGYDKEIVIPKGTLLLVLEKYDDFCLVEFCDNEDGKYPIVDGFKYEELEKLDENDWKQIKKMQENSTT